MYLVVLRFPASFQIPEMQECKLSRYYIISCISWSLLRSWYGSLTVMEMRDALKSLKEDESIMVLPAEKGRASVVMDTDTYRARMSTLIENKPCQLLNKDPTNRLTRKLSEKLLTLKRSGYLPEAVYNKIRPRHKQPPIIYGLPKIH